MKRCPYCAEEIQNEAVYCRYCNRKVRKGLIKRIAVILIILAVLFLIIFYQQELKDMLTNIRLFFYELKNLWIFFKDLMKNMKGGMEKLGNYSNRVETINHIIK